MRLLLLCLAAIVLPCAPVWAASNKFATASCVGSLDANEFWGALISGIVICARARFLRRCAGSSLAGERKCLISSALNKLNQGVLMTDPDGTVYPATSAISISAGYRAPSFRPT